MDNIYKYMQRIAQIVCYAIDMQVLICDKDRYLRGDSDINWNIIGERIKDSSILAKTMELEEIIILQNRDDHRECLNCDKKDKCDVKAIVSVPIKYKKDTVGAIAVLANCDKSREILLQKRDYLVDFIKEISEILINKLVVEEKNNQLYIMRERLISIIDSMDEALLAIDEDGKIIHYNSNIFQFFSEDIFEKKDICVKSIIDKKYIDKLIKENNSFKNKEISFIKNKVYIYCLISGKPIIIENKNIGAIISIKKMSDVYSQVNEFYSSNEYTSFDDIIGSSEEILRVKKKAAIVSKSSSTILIQGESGTGKEVFARAIHNNSENTTGPFIAINCGAIPDNLLESELFGYEEGAFTGAKKGGKIGKFQLASGGTLFLDEIGEMPFHLQTKLLRVLQERCIEKVGSNEIIPIDVKVIAATNKDLEKMVKDGEFREDLFYRLDVIPIKIPPLRERRDDISLLIDYYLEIYNSKLNKNIKGFTLDAKEILLNYNWKGNVRELQNVVEYAVNIALGDYITLDEIITKISKETVSENEDRFHILTIDEMMKKAIIKAIGYYGNDVNGKTMAAKALGISRATLYRKMNEYKI